MIYTNKLSNFRLQSHWIFLSYTVRAWFGTFEEDTDAKANKPQPILLDFFIGPNILGFWSNFEVMWIWIRGTTWIINLFFILKISRKFLNPLRKLERRGALWISMFQLGVLIWPLFDLWPVVALVITIACQKNYHQHYCCHHYCHVSIVVSIIVTTIATKV